MPENGTVKFQWVATLFAGAIAGLVGWFIASIQSDKSNYLTLREYEAYTKSIEVQLKEIHDRVKEINDKVIIIEAKIASFPTREELNNWIRVINRDGSEKVGPLKK